MRLPPVRTQPHVRLESGTTAATKQPHPVPVLLVPTHQLVTITRVMPRNLTAAAPQNVPWRAQLVNITLVVAGRRIRLSVPSVTSRPTATFFHLMEIIGRILVRPQNASRIVLLANIRRTAMGKLVQKLITYVCIVTFSFSLFACMVRHDFVFLCILVSGHDCGDLHCLFSSTNRLLLHRCRYLLRQLS